MSLAASEGGRSNVPATSGERPRLGGISRGMIAVSGEGTIRVLTFGMKPGIVRKETLNP